MIKCLSTLVQLSLIGCVSAIVAGCSSGPMVGNPIGRPFTTDMVASNGKPMVWDCAMVQMSSPPRYACGDNKTYTAFQLRDSRLGTETPVAAAAPSGGGFEPRHVPRSNQ